MAIVNREGGAGVSKRDGGTVYAGVANIETFAATVQFLRCFTVDSYGKLCGGLRLSENPILT